MQFKITLSPGRVAKYLTIGVIILTILSLGVQAVRYIYDYREDWIKMFNLDREMNIPTWYSTFMLAGCAFLLQAIARGKSQEADPSARKWHILSLIFAYLALDEVLCIHEILIIPDLAKILHLPSFLAQVWVIPGIILVGIFVKKYWSFWQNLPFRFRRLFLIAAVLYIGGALGMEMIGSLYSKQYGQQNVFYAWMTSLEETMEMLGTVTFIYALLSYIGQGQKEINVNFFIQEK